MKALDFVINAIFFIISLGVIILILGLIFSQETLVLAECCKTLGGQYVYYECQEIPFSNSPCSELKTGYWCNLPDNISINKTQLEFMFNSTL